MTEQEFNQWTELTMKSRFNWQMDFIQFANNNRMLFYIGGADGNFIEIEPNGELVLGTYEGAIPHICEALFRQEFKKQFESQEAALKRVIECGGTRFLFDFLAINLPAIKEAVSHAKAQGQ